MTTQASILQRYSMADTAGRVDIICKHYFNFLGIIESFTEGLRYMIENEKYTDNGGIIKRPASSAAIIKEAIVTCDFSGDVFEGITRKEVYQKQAVMLKCMRQDYELFNRLLSILGHDELRIFKCYLTGEKNISSIAEDEGIQYESVVQRVRRAKVKIKRQMIVFLEEIDGDMGEMMQCG